MEAAPRPLNFRKLLCAPSEVRVVMFLSAWRPPPFKNPEPTFNGSFVRFKHSHLVMQVFRQQAEYLQNAWVIFTEKTH